MGLKTTFFFIAANILLAGLLSGQNFNCGDTFVDSGGIDGNYSNGELEEWTICPDNPGDLVTLTFTVVSVESCCDDLAVYSGSDLNNPLNTDLEAPESFTSGADDGCLTVTWDSDGSVTLAGWQALITCAPPPPCPNPTNLTINSPTATGATFNWLQVGDVEEWQFEIVAAGAMATGTPTLTNITDNPYTWEGAEAGTVYDVYIQGVCNDGALTDWVGPVSFVTSPACGGFFYDNGGPDGVYNNNELQEWTFCPEEEGDVVSLNFLAVDVESCCDVLNVFNGSNTNADPLALDIENPVLLTSTATNGCLTVTWDSDGSVVREGWEAFILCDVPPACDNPTAIQLINVTNTGASFAWIQTGDVSAWDVEIVELGTAPTGTPTETDLTETAYTWTDGMPNTSYQFYVRGQCDDGGFSYWIGPLSFTTAPGCDQTFFDNGGPDGNYANNSDETTVICPDDTDDFVIMDFTTVAIDLFGDELSIYNGIGTDDPIAIDVEQPNTFFSNADNGCLTITFSSTGFGNQAGWEASVSCEPCSPAFINQDIALTAFDDNSATITLDTETPGTYRIEFDTVGFQLGMGNTVLSDTPELTLTGLAQNTEYEFYITSICDVDPTTGFTFGPFNFTTIYTNDIGITTLLEPSEDCGFGLGESILVGITNFGADPQTLFPLNFSVNGEPSGVSQPTDGFYTGIISRDSTETFEFDLMYDFTDVGEYTIQVWTDMDDDSDRVNDTLTLTIERFLPPFSEDFESGAVPDYMTVTANNVFAPGSHNNDTWVLSQNLFFTQAPNRVELPALGPISADDVLFFDYRFVDWSAGTEPAGNFGVNNILRALVSEDCGSTFDTLFVLTGDQHTPTVDFSTAEVPLGQYAGSTIKIRIEMQYGSGDYWYDLDNINIPSCSNVDISADIEGASEDEMDGTVTLTGTGGVGPYTFVWNDGFEGAIRDELAAGEYVVTLRDAVNCETTLTIFVEEIVSTVNLPEVVSTFRLAPNPTSAQTNLQVSFTRSVDVQLELVNLLGQVVWQGEQQRNVQQLQEQLDLSLLPNGVYLVRVRAGEQMISRRLIKG